MVLVILHTSIDTQLCVQSEESLPQLTPEQQRQLELIDSMPLCKETESSSELPDWDNKTPEEREQILGEHGI